MLQKHLQFSFAFAFILIIQVLMQMEPVTSKLVLSDFHYAVKPLITISLMIYLARHTELKGRFSKRIFIGLFMGLIGDSALMFVHVDELFFTYGLIAFLIGHLAYISAFYIDYAWAKGIEKRASLIAIISFGLLGIGFYWFLNPYLGGMKIPVMIYAFVISVMAIMAVNRRGRVNSLSYNLIFWGALLFLASDCLLAYNKFVQSSDYAGIAIIITYMLAQYAIVLGAIERKLRKHSMMTKRS